MRRSSLVVAVLAILVVAVAAFSAPAAKPPAKPKPAVKAKPPAKAAQPAKTTAPKPSAEIPAVGTKVCLSCHLKYKATWPDLPHSKALQPEKVGKEFGCEACHGPGGKHVKDDRNQMIRFRTLTPQQQNDICLRCHAPKVTAEHWKKSGHGKIGLKCNLCHDMHEPASPSRMLRANFDKCTVCHEDIPAKAKAGKHHKILEGIECSTCHTPHGSANGKSLVKPMGELCSTCHGK